MVKRRAEEEEEAFPRGRPDGAPAPPAAAGGAPPPRSAGKAVQAAAPPKKKRKKADGKAAAGGAGGEAARAGGDDDEAGEGDAPGAITTPQAVRSAARLRNADLTEGSLLLAAVRDVSEEELTLNLPYNMIGYVSQSQAIEPSRVSDARPPKLSALYRPGQLVVAVVMRIIEVGKGARQRLELSLRPALANAGLSAESASAQMWLPAAVQDEEEHVLRLDLGIPGLQGLLKKSEVSDLPTALAPGAILQVALLSVNASAGTARCSTKPAETLGHAPLRLETLKAGFLVHARVDKVLTAKNGPEGSNAGLVVTFCGSLVGVVHVHHQPGEGSGSAVKYKQRVTARVLAVVPGQPVPVHLTLLPHLLDWSTQADVLGGVQIGDRLEGEVLDALPRYGTRLQFAAPQAQSTGEKKRKKGAAAASLVGFCPTSRLAEKEAEDSAEVGSKVPCRVLGHNYLDAAVVVTRRAYDLKEDTLVSVTELTPGQLVVGKITRITEYGMFVQLSEYVSGLVHLRQLTDVPLASVPKRYQVDAKVKCRVLRVFPEKRQVSLTTKKSLVRDDFQLCSFEQARRDMIVTGYVSNVQPYGAIVSFYGSAYGLLPAKEMALDEAPALGMAVRCRITNVSQKHRRFGLTLNLEGGRDAAELAALRPDRGPAAGPLIGEVVTGIRATHCTKEGVYIRFQLSTPAADGEVASEVPVRGFVPVGHLSDDWEEAKSRHTELASKLGGIMGDPEPEADGELAKGVRLDEEGVVLARRHNPKPVGEDDTEVPKVAPRLTLVTLKPSMRLAVDEGAFVRDLASLEESRVYAGYVKEVRDFGALVSVGSWRLSGLAPKHQIAKHFVERPSEELEPGQTVRVLVSHVDRGKQRFTADLRPEAEVVVKQEVGAPVRMRVQGIRGLEAVCAARGGIRGHVHATQLVDVEEAAGGASWAAAAAAESSGGLEEGVEQEEAAVLGAPKPLADLEKHSLLEARILQVHKKHEEGKGKTTHLDLTCRPSLLKEGVPTSEYEAAVVRWQNLKVGRQVAAAVAEVQRGVMWMEVAPNIRGRVAPLDASADLQVVQALSDHFKVGQVYKARVLRGIAAQKQLDLSLHGFDDPPCPAKGSRTLARLEKVEAASGRGVAATFQLPNRRRGFAHVTELFDFWAQFPLKRLKPRAVYEAVVLEAEPEGRTELSLRASAVHGRAEGAGERRPLLASELQVGQKVSGYVVNANEKGVFVALSRKLVGRIRLKALSERAVQRESVARLHPPGELVREATVIEVDAEKGRVELSLRKGSDSKLTIEQLSVGDVVSGRVKAVEKYGLFMRLENSSVDGLVHISEVSDTASVSLDSYKVGDRIQRAKVLKIEGQKLWLGLKPSLFEGDVLEDEAEDEPDEDDEELAAAVAAAASAPRKAKQRAAAAPATGAPVADAADAASGAPAKAKKRKAAAEAEAEAAADSDEEAPWERAAAAALAPPAAGGPRGAASAAFEFADFRAGAASTSEEEDAGEGSDEGDEEGARKRPSKRQKKALKAAQAEEVRRREAENAEGRWANDPRSVEDFERLLLTEGDTSIVWIRYMAFHLKMSDLEKARQVAERAVKHVGFADAQERFNAWVAYMNLECTFGSEETADAVFKRAASHNDGKQVHLQLARIHERNKKPALATKAYETSCRKFPQSKRVWIDFLSFLYRQGDLEGGRKILPKALASLPRAKHPVVVCKAAILEYNHGSVERGRSVFEGLLDSYPKRTDLWSVYFDAHIRAHTPPKAPAPDLKEVRTLLERCCTMSLKPAKMRFFFKRWLDFEKRWGDEESQEHVREKARAFVESQAA